MVVREKPIFINYVTGFAETQQELTWGQAVSGAGSWDFILKGIGSLRKLSAGGAQGSGVSEEVHSWREGLG